MTTTYRLSVEDGQPSAVTFAEPETGEMTTLTAENDLFPAILAALIRDDVDELHSLLAGGLTKGQATMAERFQFVVTQLSARVRSDADGNVYFDDVLVTEPVANTIRRYMEEGRDPAGIARFIEKLDRNPSFHSRKQLWQWVDQQGLSVTPEGDILAYKSIMSDGLSKHAGNGTVYVDGAVHVGRIPNKVGSTVSMDRHDVDDDYSHDCSYGLHVGAYSYASTFAQVLTEVSFSPEDAVAVPQYDHTKIRVCKYKVLAVHLPDVDDLTHHEAPAAEDAAYDVDLDEADAALDGLVEDGNATPEKVSKIKAALRKVSKVAFGI